MQTQTQTQILQTPLQINGYKTKDLVKMVEMIRDLSDEQISKIPEKDFPEKLMKSLKILSKMRREQAELRLKKEKLGFKEDMHKLIIRIYQIAHKHQ